MTQTALASGCGSDPGRVPAHEATEVALTHADRLALIRRQIALAKSAAVRRGDRAAGEVQEPDCGRCRELEVAVDFSCCSVRSWST